MIKLRIFRWWGVGVVGMVVILDCLRAGLSGRLNAITCILVRGGRGRFNTHRREGCMKVEQRENWGCRPWRLEGCQVKDYTATRKQKRQEADSP